MPNTIASLKVETYCSSGHLQDSFNSIICLISGFSFSPLLTHSLVDRSGFSFLFSSLFYYVNFIFRFQEIFLHFLLNCCLRFSSVLLTLFLNLENFELKLLSSIVENISSNTVFIHYSIPFGYISFHSTNSSCSFFLSSYPASISFNWVVSPSRSYFICSSMAFIININYSNTDSDTRIIPTTWFVRFDSGGKTQPLRWHFIYYEKISLDIGICWKSDTITQTITAEKKDWIFQKY